MAPRDPNKVQLDFPVLVADLIDQLSLTGAVGVMEFSDVVTPVFLIGSRGITFGSLLPDFASTEITFGSAVSPAINAVIADTGQLPAGTYDLFASVSVAGNSGIGGVIALQHRDAANAATLATILAIQMTGTNLQSAIDLPPIGYQIGLNERIRCFQVGPGNVTGGVACTIGHAIRPTP